MARAPVSKTGGWGFETLHPCQFAGSGIWGSVRWASGIREPEGLGIGSDLAIIEGFDERGVPTGKIRA